MTDQGQRWAHVCPQILAFCSKSRNHVFPQYSVLALLIHFVFALEYTSN